MKAFAAWHGAERYLEPLKDALAKLFPTATRARVILEQDPELRDERHVTFEIDSHWDNDLDFLRLTRAWGDELFRIVPSTKAVLFRLFLYPIDD